MCELGVVVGCDQKQEWLLPWWWEHYSEHNSYPVAFADFGMTPQALDWCRKKGLCLELSFPKIFHEEEIELSEKNRWEERYGKGIWFSRSAWFKKPLALLNCPFSSGLWIDLDCQINGSLEPLFNSLAFDAEIGVVKEPLFIQEYEETKGFLLPGEINYNAGVIVFRQNSPILHRWIEEAIVCNDKYVGDQPALNRAIFKYKPSLAELPSEYNWLRVMGPNPDALIYHFTGGSGKMEILKNTDLRLLHFVPDLSIEKLQLLGSKDDVFKKVLE